MSAVETNEEPTSSGPTTSPEEPQDLASESDTQTAVWVVRAHSDEQAGRFVSAGYTGIGWFDLSSLHDSDEIWTRVKEEFPKEGSSLVGMLRSFRFEMKEGDYVLTPSSDREFLQCGRVTGSCEHLDLADSDGIRNRRPVTWAKSPIPWSALSDSLKQTLNSNSFVFRVKQRDEFLKVVNTSAPFAGESDESGLEREPEDPNQESKRPPFDSSTIRVHTRHVMVTQLISRLDYKEIDLSPDFQRMIGIWNPKRRSRLIESLLLRIPIPLFYVAEDVNEHWSVVDGVQRISTIYDYIKNKFPLTRLEYRQDLNGMLHTELPRPMQRRISETSLVINVIQPGTPEEVMFNIFHRINTGGQPLNAQEIRHALVKGPVREYLRKLAKSDEFTKATAGSVGEQRMADRECVLRFLAFHIMPWEDYQAKSLDAYLVKAMKLVNSMSVDDRNTLKSEFCKSMSASFRIFGPDSFRKIGLSGGRKGPVNKSLLEAWSVQLARCSDDQIDRLVDRREKVRSRFEAVLKNDKEFEQSVSASTGSPSRIEKRFSTIRDLVQDLI